MTGYKLTAVLLSVIGGLMSLVGLMLGLMPRTAGIGLDCGSGFLPDHSANFLDCLNATDSARSIALALLVPGLIALAVGGFMLVWHWQMARDAAVEIRNASSAESSTAR